MSRPLADEDPEPFARIRPTSNIRKAHPMLPPVASQEHTAILPGSYRPDNRLFSTTTFQSLANPDSISLRKALPGQIYRTKDLPAELRLDRRVLVRCSADQSGSRQSIILHGIFWCGGGVTGAVSWLLIRP
jgi:hypothetical protein